MSRKGISLQHGFIKGTVQKKKKEVAYVLIFKKIYCQNHVLLVVPATLTITDF